MVIVVVPSGFRVPGLAEQVTPLIEEVQELKVTVPLKPFCFCTLTRTVAEPPRDTDTDGLKNDMPKSPEGAVLAFQFVTRLNASTVPRPVVWSYPTPAV